MIDESQFFREATLRICGSLDIEKALHACLLYIQKYIPAGQMCFHVYHRDIGVVETVARATMEKGESLSIKASLNAKAREQINRDRSIRLRLVNRLGDDVVTQPVAQHLNALDLSAVVMDLVLENKFLGILSVFDDGRRSFNGYHIRLLSLLNEPFAVALTNSLRYRELLRFKDLLADDNRYFQDELRRLSGEIIIGADFGLRAVMGQIRQVAPTNSPVLILGETGTGKELVASTIHHSSPRRRGPFIKVNCGAIPPTLMDSELFGHEKGAFTGAISQKRGRIERAHGGTLFLDEIGELPPEAQVRLLRVLQEKEIDRIGGSEPVKVDIRIIAATHRNLDYLLSRGEFREDLYFRLKVFPIVIPPLRERTGDIPALVQHFIRKKANEMKMVSIPPISPEAMDRLIRYAWPGNARELENAVERELIVSKGHPLAFNDIQRGPMHPPVQAETDPSENRPPSLELDKMMAAYITEVLKMCKGRVEGEKGAARVLNIHPSTLRKRMRKLGIPFGRKTNGGLRTEDKP
jgi:transcriptional regulator with GAF, ATPase, and Fis domain